MREIMNGRSTSSTTSTIGLLERRGSTNSLKIKLSSSCTSHTHTPTSTNQTQSHFRHGSPGTTTIPIMIQDHSRPLFFSCGSSSSPRAQQWLSQDCLSSASNRLTRSSLRSSLRADVVKDLYQEFIEIPLNHPGKSDHLPGCSSKNRYRSIWPNPTTRVYLKPYSSTTSSLFEVDENDNKIGGDAPPLLHSAGFSFEVDNNNNDNEDSKDPPSTSSSSSSYINANYIRSYDNSEDNGFIAAQGPLPNTVNDFWQMVWQENTPIIVQMTKLVERNKVKCEAYLPLHQSSGESAFYGQIKVTVRQIIAQNGYFVRDIILQKGEKYKQIRHYWFTGWPDQKAPKSTARQLLNMMKQIRTDQNQCKSMKNGCKGPIVVHCSAGIGRTGCFIGSWIGMRQLCEENSVDILRIVSQMRLDRGGMIQTPEQYEFLHHILGMFEAEEMTTKSDQLQ